MEQLEAQSSGAEATQLGTEAENAPAEQPEIAPAAPGQEPHAATVQPAESIAAPSSEVSPEPPAETTTQASPAGPSHDVRLALVALEEQVTRFHERSARSEEIIREMQSRITDLQGDQILALLKPTIQRFAGLHSQAAEAHQAALERGETAAADFSFFMTAIEDALGLINLDSVGAAVGIAFDATRHHATGTVATGDRALDKTVQRVVRQGFTYADAARVSIPAQVTVYQFDESLASAAPAPTDAVEDSPTPSVTL